MDMWHAMTAKEEGEVTGTGFAQQWKVNGKRLNGGGRRYGH